MNALLSGMWILHQNVVRHIKGRFPNILITPNFEQIKALVLRKEIERIIIISDVYNYSPSRFNATRGQEAAQHLHQTDPTIPILIWDGRNYNTDDDFPSVFTITGRPWPIKYNSELYLEFEHYDLGKIIDICSDFLKGTLKVSSIPKRDCSPQSIWSS